MACEDEVATSMMVVVDQREPPDIEQRITALLSDATVIVAQLPVGDIRMDWLTIERKTPRDFMNSWHSGHLDDQICNMIARHGPKRPMLAVHGVDDADLTKDEWDRLMKHLWTLNLHIPSFYFPTLDELIMFGAHRVDAWRRGQEEYRKRPVKVLQVSKRKREVLEIYASLPGVSDELAERIAEVYKTPAKLTDAIRGQRTLTDEKKSKPWHDAIEGIGKKKAEAIRAVWLGEEMPPDWEEPEEP
jgi:ERCC4-type nuclease